MKKIILLFLIVGVFGSKISAQSLVGDEIVGTWKVLKINVLKELPPEQLQLMAMLKNAFLKAKFTFEENQNFSFDFQLQGMAISNAKWNFNKDNNSYTIQASNEKNNNKMLMEIITKKEADKILFFLSESSVSLEMQRE